MLQLRRVVRFSLIASSVRVIDRSFVRSLVDWLVGCFKASINAVSNIIIVTIHRRRRVTSRQAFQIASFSSRVHSKWPVQFPIWRTFPDPSIDIAGDPARGRRFTPFGHRLDSEQISARLFHTGPTNENQRAKGRSYPF